MTTPDPLRILSKAELAEITGVKARGRNSVARTTAVLDKAAIRHWLGDDGHVKTTWHHVFSAGTVEQQAPPRFGRPDMSKVK